MSTSMHDCPLLFLCTITSAYLIYWVHSLKIKFNQFTNLKHKPELFMLHYVGVKAKHTDMFLCEHLFLHKSDAFKFLHVVSHSPVAT